jgi:hypothetical protein
MQVRAPRHALIVATGLVAASAVAGPVHAAGGLDRTFSGDGWTVLGTTVSGTIPAPILTVTGTGRSWVLSHRAPAIDDVRIHVVRHTASGAADPGWNRGQPRLVVTPQSVIIPVGLVATADGGAVVAVADAYIQGRRGYVVRTYAKTGVLTSTSAHRLPANYSSAGLAGFARLADGAVRLCAQTDEGDLLVGLDSTGKPDAELGPDGLRALAGDDPCWGIARDHLGRIVIRGGDGVIRRLTRAGVPDPDFGIAGETDTSDPAGTLSFLDVQPLIEPDGGVVLGSTFAQTDQGRVVDVVRLTADGDPDGTFGTAGRVRLDFGYIASRLVAIARDPSGRYVISVSSKTATGTRAELVRLTHGGDLDPAFGTGGRLVVSRVAFGLGIDGAGRIVTLGVDGQRLILARRTG